MKQNSKTRDIPYERVVFNEITKTAILKAIETPRGLDIDLIEAYLARRALDHLLDSASLLFYGASCPVHVQQAGCSLLRFA